MKEKNKKIERKRIEIWWMWGNEKYKMVLFIFVQKSNLMKILS